MNQWSLFKRSWSIFWKYKTLWVFGLLAALGGGSVNMNFNFSATTTNPFANLPVGGRELLRQIFQAIDLNSLIAVGVVIGIVLFVISTFARAGLYRMINAIEENQALSVGEGLSAASEKFLPLSAVRLILALPIIILGAIAAGSFAAMFSQFIGAGETSNPFFDFSTFGALAGLGVVIALLALLMQAISISAERAVVLDDLSVFGSIARGWKYLWSRFADYFTIGLIFILLTIGVGILLACALAPLFLASLGSIVGNLRPGVNIFAFNLSQLGPAIVVAVIIGLIFGTFYSVFEIGVWTLAYRQWRVSDRPI